jgi:hypothetical protein
MDADQSFVFDPCASVSIPIAGQRMNFPCGKGAQFRGGLHAVEKEKHLPQFVHRTRGNAFRYVVVVEPF